MILEQKIARSVELLQHVFDETGPDRTAVAWTGGKDSTVALFLWRQVLRAREGTDAVLRAVNLDTGLKFPEILAFRDRMAREWEVAVTVARPVVDPAAYPVAQNTVDCCRDLKILPLKQAVADTGLDVLLTGVRGDENAERRDRPVRESRSDPDHVLIHPLLHWSEMDIWSFHMQEGLPYCELYDQGYRSLGCMPCTTLPGTEGEERSGRNPDKEAHMDQLRALGYF
ncbi:MAG TPA: phosphoadenosine phosphosulfate reductase family protein [Desulfomicrobiaceae bacterium]|nr:phosphoadenosine phosphosulfate reductase family protein [Desulfomicrobiaceae bacterium]